MALVKCPECGKEISNQATKCPECGFPIQKSIYSHKKTFPKKRILVFVFVIIILGAGFIKISTKDTSFEKCTKYIGEDFSKLPQEYTLADKDNDVFYMSNTYTEGEIEFDTLGGTITYTCAGKDLDDYIIAKQGEIINASWEPDDSIITNDNVVNIINKLEKEYGQWEDCVEEYSSASTYTNTTYSWEDVNGVDVVLRTSAREGYYKKYKIFWYNENYLY